MGRDAIEPFVAAARASAAPACCVLVRTSNPGAADVEDLALAGGGAVWERARRARRRARATVGERRAQRRRRGDRRDRARAPRSGRAS